MYNLQAMDRTFLHCLAEHIIEYSRRIALIIQLIGSYTMLMQEVTKLLLSMYHPSSIMPSQAT